MCRSEWKRYLCAGEPKRKDALQQDTLDDFVSNGARECERVSAIGRHRTFRKGNKEIKSVEVTYFADRASKI